MELMFKTSPETPPPFNHVSYFERSCDPFHPKKIQEAFGSNEKAELPETGWMGIDWAENPVCFVPDGTGYKFPKPDFELVKGYFDDGRMFAYPTNNPEFLAELKERHTEEVRRRESERLKTKQQNTTKV